MGWLGGGVGAAVGGALLGPLGFGAGAALGALFEDWLDEDGDQAPIPTLPMTLEGWDSDDGRTYLLRPEFDSSAVEAFVIRFRHQSGAWVRGRAEYADDEGDFLTQTEPLADDGTTAFFVPRGAMCLQGQEDLDLEIAVVGDGVLMGVATFDDLDHLASMGLDRVGRLRPLLELAHAVITADGRDTRKAAGRSLRELLEIGAEEKRSFKRTWDSAQDVDVPAAAFELNCRLHRVPPGEFVELLAELLLLRPGHSPRGIELVRQVALEYGLDPEDWPEEALRLGLVGDAKAEGAAEAYAVLGLDDGSGFGAVREAYRALMKDYHPDVVAHLPSGYQEYATMRSQEINAAYQLVLRDLQEGHS